MADRDRRFIASDDEQADMWLRQRLGALQAVPPPDLVTRTARRLPNMPPTVAARVAARQRALRRMLAVTASLAVAFVALAGLLDMLDAGPSLAGWFGDGRSGFSRAVLVVQLLLKPLLGTLLEVGLVPLVVSALVALGGGWLWWRLAQPSTAAIEVEARS